jgi:hypothetical protein
MSDFAKQNRKIVQGREKYIQFRPANAFGASRLGLPGPHCGPPQPAQVRSFGNGPPILLGSSDAPRPLYEATDAPLVAIRTQATLVPPARIKPQAGRPSWLWSTLASIGKTDVPERSFARGRIVRADTGQHHYSGTE